MKMLKLAGLLMAAASFLPAEAATIDLIQGGWDVGGPLTISLAGEDSDASGYLEDFELTVFTANFLLEDGSIINWDLDDLDGESIGYASPSDYFFFVEGPEYTLYNIAGPDIAFGFVANSLGELTAVTGEPLQEVPEPSTAVTVGLTGLGLILITGVRRWTAPLRAKVRTRRAA